MRLIPGKTKVKIELFRKVTLSDVAVGLVGLVAVTLCVVSSLPGRWIIAMIVAAIFALMLFRIEEEPMYVFMWHMLRYKAYPRRYSRVFSDKLLSKAGYENAAETAKLAGEALNISSDTVLVASTGVIGFTLPMDVIADGVKKLSGMLKSDVQSAQDAAEAILTTDTHPKQIAYETTIGGKTVTFGAMCKGSGMIHPNMGTMLGFIMTDAAISKELLDKALKGSIEDTFNMVSVDGDTSTNDTVLVMANGMAGNPEITEENEDYEAFKEVLLAVNTYLAKQIAGDGEGASRLFEVQVKHAKDKQTAKVLAKSIITSNLTKCAIFGKDANWGRILCAMGYSGAQFDPLKVDIVMASEKGEIALVENGVATAFDEEKAAEILSPDVVIAKVDVRDGDAEATAWGCDLTYDYVKINADYRS